LSKAMLPKIFVLPPWHSWKCSTSNDRAGRVFDSRWGRFSLHNFFV
jgi:hypothetical protein